MKYSIKKRLSSVLLPILLIMGLLACVFISQIRTSQQFERIIYAELKTWTNNESRLFASMATGRLNALDTLAITVKNSDIPGDRSIDEVSCELCDVFGFSCIALADDSALSYLCGEPIVGYDDSLLSRVSFERPSSWLAVPDSGEGEPLLAYSVPIAVDSGVALIGYMPGSLADSDLESCASFDSADGYIISPNGIILAKYQSRHAFATGDNIYSELFGASAAAFKNDMQAARWNGSGYYDTLGGREYVSCVPIGVDGSCFLTTMSADYITSRLRQHSNQNIAYAALAFVLATTLFAVLVYKARQRRLELEGEQAQRMETLMVDELTGIYTQQGFEYKAASALPQLPEDKVCAMVAFEIISFRSFNALYGFERGDSLLRDLAQLAIERSKPGEVCGHLYADRFVWLVYNDSLEDIRKLLLDSYFNVRGHQLPFYLCSGIYEITDRSVPISEMIDKASIAKEANKTDFTKGATIYDDSMLDNQLQDAELVSRMTQGIADGEFVDFYQAKYRTDSETVAGAEALVRWRKPNGELVPPGRFIELFEKNGFIRKLDLYMLDKVCRMLRSRFDSGEKAVPVSVNFSRVHIFDPTFPQSVINILESYKIPPEYIEIELTESAFLSESASLNTAVDKLHSYGLAVAIDDFGSGYSSLNMLKDVPVDVLKIDMRFLEGFEHGGKVGTVVTSVIRMAKWLGVPVVAEGVETKEQVDFLRTLGCDMVQGYYYARPIDRSAFEKLLSSTELSPSPKEAPAALTLESVNELLGGNSLLTSLMDTMVGGFGLYELSGDRLEAIRVNRNYYELMGYPDLTSFSSASFNVIDKVYPADRQSFLDVCRRAVELKTTQGFACRRYSYSGAILQFRGLIKHIGGSTEMPLLCITFMDATESLKAERERELSKYSDALYGIYDEIYEFNFSANTFRLLSANKVRRSDKVMPLDEAEKKWFGKVVYSEDRLMIEGITEELRRGTIRLPFTDEFRINTPLGVRWVSSSIVRVSEGSYLLCSLDITDKKQVESFVESMEGLHQRMELDMDTGVLSADTSESFIRQRLRLDDTKVPSALLLFSIEYFESISSALGKVTAGALLKECAQRIKAGFKEQDVVGRFEENKFIVLVSGVAAASIAVTKALRAQSSVLDIALPEGRAVDCRVGICVVPPGERDFDKALKNTRAALKKAQTGTDRCVLFEETV